jgi:hypothetical protein
MSLLTFILKSAVLIHGIYGTSPDSWMTGSNSIWISKALADVSPRMGRIMSYGYHTDLEKGRYYSPHGVYEEAEALLESLQDFRKPEIKVRCPMLVIDTPTTNASIGI